MGFLGSGLVRGESDEIICCEIILIVMQIPILRDTRKGRVFVRV